MSAARPVFRAIFRWGLAALLFATALGKALDVPGFFAVLATYQTFPDFLVPVAGVGMIAVEAALALWLASGRRLAAAALAAAGLHAAFTVLSAVTLLRGIVVPNCGCFGVFLARPLTWGTVQEDLFMTAWCLALFALAERKPRATTAP